ncbi:hypothetical protein [Mycobacterium spongiae]|uniref:Uncharacterized protein n=1 Tax=Mycobacterium spongiae TaxID=886343 RepID=A0A975PXX9_9MYCO|nr:hypothetical protein [Mycobacterium spongiae]QUR68562.1 hypothetical protein F6B93_17055 [Mycobacterium spongiae]
MFFVGVVLLLSTGACGSSSSPPHSASSDAPAGACPTTAPSFGSGEIRAALESTPLPAGVTLVSQEERPSIDDRSKIDVVVIICQPGLVGGQLKGVATMLARSLQTSGIAPRVLMLLVGNVAEDAHPEGEVRLDDLGHYAFSPSTEIEAAWKYAAES